MVMPEASAFAIPGHTMVDELVTWVTSSQEPTAGTASAMGVATDGSPRAKETPAKSALSCVALWEVCVHTDVVRNDDTVMLGWVMDANAALAAGVARAETMPLKRDDDSRVKLVPLSTIVVVAGAGTITPLVVALAGFAIENRVSSKAKSKAKKQ